MKRTLIFLVCFVVSFLTPGISKLTVVQAVAGGCSGPITGSGAATFTFSIATQGHVNVSAFYEANKSFVSVTHSGGSVVSFDFGTGFETNSFNANSFTPLLDTVTISGS